MVERCDRYTRLSKNVRASKPRIHERARPAKIDMTAVMPSGKKKKTYSSMRSTPASRGEKYHGHSPHREPAYRSSNAVASKRPMVANIRSRHVQRFRSETALGWVGLLVRGTDSAFYSRCKFVWRFKRTCRRAATIGPPQLMHHLKPRCRRFRVHDFIIHYPDLDDDSLSRKSYERSTAQIRTVYAEYHNRRPRS